MKIAVTSQNQRTITGHAGRCRKFWIFNTKDSEISDKELLELPQEQSLHESANQASHPLYQVDVLIAGSMGQGLVTRLERKGIKWAITEENEPEKAVLLYLNGTLKSEAPHQHHHHTHR
jgi:predicted Fe-Mo cluster-binding NifX family protein